MREDNSIGSYYPSRRRSYTFRFNLLDRIVIYKFNVISMQTSKVVRVIDPSLAANLSLRDQKVQILGGCRPSDIISSIFRPLVPNLETFSDSKACKVLFFQVV